MAFTATLKSASMSDDAFSLTVLFGDSDSGFSREIPYSFPLATTLSTMTNKITADGTAMKARLGALNTLQNNLGTVITI